MSGTTRSARPGEPTTRPPATVVICAYTASRLKVLRAAAAAVRDQLLDGDELVIVIDHNEQLQSAAVEAFADDHPHVRVVANENHPGLSGARNAGIEAARGELVAFLDDDAVPRPGWLATLAEAFSEPGVIGAGGVAVAQWETGRPDWLPEEFLWVVGCSYRGLSQLPAEIRNPIGANMAFRRSVLRQVGGFTDGIGRVGRVPLGCEETELSIRATRASGGRILHQPEAVVDHLVIAERLRLRYFLSRCWAEGISKAVVTTLTGRDAGLASERHYTTRTLPAGLAAGLRDGIVGDRSGFKRAAAILVGLAITVAGYLLGSVRVRRGRLGPAAASPPPAAPHPAASPPPAAPHPAASPPPAAWPTSAMEQFTPIWSGQLELTAPSAPEQLTDPDGQPLQQARLLVRAAGTPLGFLQVDSPGGKLDLDRVVELAEINFAEAAAQARADSSWVQGDHRLVSIVLCTRNRADGAGRTLNSLLALKHREVEIIVVDNAPRDGSTRELVERIMQADARVRYVREDRRGLSCARNRGLSEARGELIAFTDDDVGVDPLWIDGLLRGFGRAPEVACVTGLVASASLQRRAEQYFDRRVWWSSSCEPHVFTARRGDGDSPLHPYTAGMFGTGANFAARTSVLRDLGGFDECLGAGSPTQGGEDLDLFVRLVTSGHAIGYEPSALVWHEHRVDDAALRAQMYAYGLGLSAYMTKHLLGRRSRSALLRRLPGLARHALTLVRRSREAAGAASLEQPGTTAVEIRGMLVGPLAYARARRNADPGHVRAVAP